MESIEITTWQCPICKSVYSDKNEAIACSSKPIPTPRFAVGDEVYIQIDHPEDENKLFVKRVIAAVYGVFKDVADQHRVGYGLDNPIYKGDRYIGDWAEWRTQDSYPALEDDLYSLGDRRKMWNPKTLKWGLRTLTSDMLKAQN